MKTKINNVMKFFKIFILVSLLNTTILFGVEDRSPNVECMFAYSINKSQECYDWYNQADIKDIEHLKSDNAKFKKCIISNCGDLYFDENDPIQKRNSYQYRFIEKKGCEEIVDLELLDEDIVPTYFYQSVSRGFKDKVQPATDGSGNAQKTQTNVPFKLKRLFCPSQEVEQCMEKDMALQFPVMCYKDKANTPASTKELLKQCIEEHNRAACEDPLVKAITKGNVKKTIAWVYCDEDKNGDFYPESISSELLTSLSNANITCDPSSECKKDKVCTVIATCEDVQTIHKEDLKSEKCENLGRPYNDFVVNIGCNAYSDIYRDDPKCARINSIEQGRERNITKTIRIKSQRSGKLDDYVEYISYRKYPDINYNPDHNATMGEANASSLITKEIFLAYFNPYDYKKVKKGPSFLGALVAFVIVVALVIVSGGTALVALAYAAAAGLIVAAGTYVANPPGTYDDKTYIVDPGIMDRTVMLNYTVNRYDSEHKLENITFKKWTKSGWFKKKTTTVYMGVQYNEQLVKGLVHMGETNRDWNSTAYWKWNGRTPYRIDYAFDLNMTVAPGDAEIIGVYNINNATAGAEFPETQIKTVDAAVDCGDNSVISGTINTGYPALTKQISVATLPKRNIASMGLIIPFNGCYTFKFYKSEMHYDMEKIEHNFNKPFAEPNLSRTDSSGTKYAKTCDDLWIDSGYTPTFRNTNDAGDFSQAYAEESATETTGKYSLNCESGYKFRYCDATFNGSCMVDDYMMGYMAGSKTVDLPQTVDTAPKILVENAQGVLVETGSTDITQHPDYDSALSKVKPITIVCDCKAQRGVMKGDPSKTEPLFVRTKCFYPGDTYPVTLEMIDASGAQTYAEIFPSESTNVINSYTSTRTANSASAISDYTNELVDAIAKVNSIKFIHEKFHILRGEEPNGLDNNYLYPIDLTREPYYQNFNIRTEEGINALVAIKAYTEAVEEMTDIINGTKDMSDDYPGWLCHASDVGSAGISTPSNKTSEAKLNQYVTALKPFLEDAECSNISNYTSATIVSGASECEFKKFAVKTTMCNLYNKNIVNNYEGQISTDMITFINDRYTKADELANIVYNDFPKIKDKVNEYLLHSNRYATAFYDTGIQENNLIFKSASSCGDYQIAKNNLANDYTSTVNQIFTFANYADKLLAIKDGLSQVVDNNFDTIPLSYQYKTYNKSGTSKWDIWHDEVMGSDENGTSCSSGATCTGYSAAAWGSQDGSCSGNYTWYSSADSAKNNGISNIKNTTGYFNSFGEYACDKKMLISNGDEDDVCKSSLGSGQRNLTQNYGSPSTYTTVPVSTNTWPSSGKRIKSTTNETEIKNVFEEKWMQENRFKNGYGDYDNSKDYQNVLLHYLAKDSVVKKEANDFIRIGVRSYVRSKIREMYLASTTSQIHSDVDTPATIELDNAITTRLISQYPQNLVEGDFAAFNFIKIIDIFDETHTVDKEILTPGGLLIKEPNNFYVSIAPMAEVRQYRCYGDWDVCGFENEDNCTVDLEHQPNPKYTSRVTDFDGKNIPILKDEFYSCKYEVDVETCNQFSYSKNCSDFKFTGLDNVDYDSRNFGESFSKNIGQAVAINEMPAIFGAEDLRCDSGYFWDFSWLTDPMFYLEALTGLSMDMFSGNSDAGDSVHDWTLNNIDYSTCSSSWASYMIEAGCGPLDIATQVLDSEGELTRMCDTREQSKEATTKVRYTNAGCRDFADPLGYELSDVQKDSLNTSLTDELGVFKPFAEAGITYLSWTDYLGPLESLAAKMILKLLTDTFSHCNQCTNLECAQKFAPDEAEKVYRLTNGRSELSHFNSDEFGLGDNDGVGPDVAFEMYGNCYYYNKGCSKKILRKCVRKKYEHCCYSSKLATVLVGQIYKQQGWTFENDGCEKVKLETLSDVDWSPCPPGVTPKPGLKCINYKVFQDYIVNRIDWSITKTIDPGEILDGYLDSQRMMED